MQVMRTVKMKLAIVLSLSSFFGCSSPNIYESKSTAYSVGTQINHKAVDLYLSGDEARLKLLLKADLWLLDHPMVLLSEEKRELASRIKLLEAMLRRISLSQD